jgi:hypothetical protein
MGTVPAGSACEICRLGLLAPHCFKSTAHRPAVARGRCRNPIYWSPDRIHPSKSTSCQRDGRQHPDVNHVIAQQEPTLDSSQLFA